MSRLGSKANMAGAFTAGIRQNAFRLPTREECIDAESQLHLTLPCLADERKCKPSASQRRHMRRKVAAAKTDEPEVIVAEPVTSPKPARRIMIKQPFVGVFVD